METAYSDISSTYQIDFTVKSSGKRISLTKRRVQWRFGFVNRLAKKKGKASIDCRGEEHEITLIWSASSGKRTILFDGEEIHNSKGRNKMEYSWGWRSCHTFKVVAHGPTVSPKSGVRRFDLYLDGRSYFDFLKIYQLGSAIEKSTVQKDELFADDHYGSVQNDFGQSSSSLYNQSLLGDDFFAGTSTCEESKNFGMEQSVGTLNPTNKCEPFVLLTEITADAQASSKYSCDTSTDRCNKKLRQQENKEFKDLFSHHNPIVFSEVHNYPEACAEPKSPECPLNQVRVREIYDEKAIPVTVTEIIPAESYNADVESRSLSLYPPEGVTDIAPYGVTMEVDITPAKDISPNVDKAMQKLVNLDDLNSLSTIKNCDRPKGTKNSSGAIPPIDNPWYSNQTLQEMQVNKPKIAQKEIILKPLIYPECRKRVPQNRSTGNHLHLTQNFSSGYGSGQESRSYLAL